MLDLKTQNTKEHAILSWGCFSQNISFFPAIWRKEVYILQKTCSDVFWNWKKENNYIIMWRKVNQH